MKWCLLSLISLLLPYSAQAAVSISEVAWMGSSASANHEWIELHNDGSAQDVSGWTLSDGVNLSIDLTGTISQNSYAVLERTSEDSAPGTAFLVYTGALVNTGATLRLTRSDGSLVDQVSGGTDWESIGGDNATKETAQYTSSGWVTAAPTPGAGLNWTVEEDTSEDDDTETLNQEDLKKTSTVSTRKTKSSSAETVRLILPDVSLKLVVDAQSLGYVNQPISFSVKPSGIGDTLIDSLQYEWNFGDGLTSDQKEPTHIFSYPGTYVVTAYAGFKRQEQVTRHEITILPVAISLTTNKNGDVQVNNDSPYEIDISNYRLRGGSVFEFPPRSIILPNQTITIAKARLDKKPNSMVTLYDTEGILLSSIAPTSFSYSPTVASTASKPVPQISAISVSRPIAIQPDSNFSFASLGPKEVAGSEVVDDVVEVVREEISPAGQLANNASAKTNTDDRWTYLALAGVLLLGTVSVYVKPKSNEKR